MLERIEAHIWQHGFGLSVVDLRGDHTFIGFVGLAVPSFQAYYTPCVEIGWRLSADCWGQCLATEGAGQMVAYAFAQLRLTSLVSFTATGNVRSSRLLKSG